MVMEEVPIMEAMERTTQYIALTAIYGYTVEFCCQKHDHPQVNKLTYTNASRNTLHDS